MGLWRSRLGDESIKQASQEGSRMNADREGEWGVHTVALMPRRLSNCSTYSVSRGSCHWVVVFEV